MIKIQTKKVVNSDGERGYIVTDLEALRFEELPQEYLKKEENFFLRDWYSQKYDLQLCEKAGKGSQCKAFAKVILQTDDKVCKTNTGSDTFLQTGMFYTEEEFSNILEFIRKAGENLREVNKNIKSLRQEWRGEETFII